MEQHSRIDEDIEKRAASGAYIYSAAWLLVGIGTGFIWQSTLWFFAIFSAFVVLGACRLVSCKYAPSLRMRNRVAWLTLIYGNTLAPALLLSVLFSCSLVLASFQPLFLYLLLTLFALLSGGVVSLSPRPDLSLTYLMTLLIPPILASTFFSSEFYLEATMLTVYGAFMLALSRRLNNEYRQLITNQIELEQLNKIDGLTGIANRRTFDNFLDMQWASQARSQSNLSLILVDIDFFKRINDTYGHAAGDKVIQTVAHLIKGICKRDTDCVARIGGEEFAVVIPTSEPEHVFSLANEIRESVSVTPVLFEGKTIEVTVSVGVSTCIPNAKLPKSVLFKSADKNLYKAKDGGRNKVVSQFSGT